MGRLLDIARVAATYAGTVIGAGFASGQELLQFFVSYGAVGIIAMLFSGFLFALLGARILELGYRLRATNYHQVLYYICGPRLGLILDSVSALFLFGGLCIMLSGTGTVSRDYFEISYNTGSIAMVLAVAITVLFGVKGISLVNLLVIPLLIASTLTVGISSLTHHCAELSGSLLSLPAQPHLSPAPHWLLACLLYVSYNLILGATVLAPLGREIKDRSVRLWGGILGGILLTLLGLIIILVIMLHYPDILSFEVPMLYVSNSQHNFNHLSYAAMLIKAMFSTAMASLYGCTVKLQSVTGMPFWLCLLNSAIVALLFSQVGFANLVSTLYPLFGYIALLFTFALLWQLYRDKR